MPLSWNFWHLNGPLLRSSTTTFTVYTDNNPLTYILTTAKMDETGHRLLASLGNYHFDRVYRPGTSNRDADGMTQLPEITIEKDQQTQIQSESPKAVCSMSMNAHSYIECLDFSFQVIDDAETVIQGQEVMSISKEELREAQRRDPVLSMWIRYIKDGNKPVRQELQMPPDHTTMYRNVLIFVLKMAWSLEKSP